MIRAFYHTAPGQGPCAAAPAGGAAPWRGWGCAMVVVLGSTATGQAAEPVAVPSGQPVTLNEVLLDETPGALWVRFRFVAPGIARDGGAVTPEAAAPDMDHLCAEVALPYLDAQQIEAARIVISLSDRLVEFGAPDPDATQFFELYRPENGLCIWEAF